MDKRTSKQTFRSLDALVVVVSLVAIAVVVTPIVGRQITSKQTDLAQSQTLQLAETLLTTDYKRVIFSIQPSQEGGGRKIASATDLPKPINPNEGEVGRDPWGNPYLYRVIRNAYGQPSMLAVWSIGANSRNETTESVLRASLDQIHNDTKIFGGDDVGNLKSVK